jgi:hypothetical protein
MKRRKSSNRSRSFRILGYRIRKGRVYRGALTASIFLCGFVALVGIAYLDDDSLPVVQEELILMYAPKSSTESEVVGANRAVDELQSILGHHREAVGLDGVKGLTLHGSYLEGSEEYSLALSLRSHEMIRKKIESDMAEIVCVTQGALGEVKITRKGFEPVIRGTEDDLFWYMLILEGATLRLTQANQQGGFTPRLLPVVDGEVGRRIMTEGSSGVILTHLIDTETGLELERRLELRIKDKLHVLELKLSDYREVSGATLPHHYEMFINGQAKARMRVVSIQVNPGLAPWMFALSST